MGWDAAFAAVTYALVLITILAGPTGEAQTEAAVLDSDLSLEDCQLALSTWRDQHMTMPSGVSFHTKLSCQPE